MPVEMYAGYSASQLQCILVNICSFIYTFLLGNLIGHSSSVCLMQHPSFTSLLILCAAWLVLPF